MASEQTELQHDMNELKAFLQALDFEVDGKMIKTVEACIALASLPVEGGGWVSVNIGIPNPEIRVRVKYEDGGTEDRAFWRSEGRCCVLGARAGSYPPGWCSEEAGGLPVDNVVAWMPLASPPKPTDNTDQQ
jgi:hypothetical protein